MKIVILVFALLGIGLHVRTLGFLVDPQQLANFANQWETAALVNRVLVVASMTVPLVFYIFCIASSFAKTRTWWITLSGLVICLLAVPFFIKLHQRPQNVIPTWFITAMFAIPYYLAKPTTLAGSDKSPIAQ